VLPAFVAWACSSTATNPDGSGPGGGGSGAGGSGGSGATGGSVFCGGSATLDGDVCILHTLTESGASVGVDAKYVYFATHSEVGRIPKNGSEPASTLHDVNGTSIAGMVVTDQHVCWSEQATVQANGEIKCHDLKQNVTSTVALSQAEPFHLAADDAWIYWTLNTTPGSVRRWTPTTTVKDVATGPDFPTAIVANTTDPGVYWATPFGIFRANKDNSGPPEQVYSPDAKWPASPRLALGEYLFFTQTDGLRAVSTQGGSALDVATESSEIGAMALDAKNVYWGTLSATSAIRYQPQSGPPAATLAPGHGPVRWMAVDDSAVYWITDTVVAKAALP
jgi:hypothetical protein